MLRVERMGERLCPSCGRSFGEDVLFCPTDGAPLARASLTSAGDGDRVDPYIGLQILGQIEITRLAGIGSMARVYRDLLKPKKLPPKKKRK